MFKKKELCSNFIINKNCTIKQAISAIDLGGLKIAIVLDENSKLIGTVCDGDIRRGLFKRTKS